MVTGFGFRGKVADLVIFLSLLAADTQLYRNGEKLEPVTVEQAASYLAMVESYLAMVELENES